MSCYDAPINVDNYLANGTCVSSCGSGYFPLGTESICTKCVSPCENCIDSATKCTSCLNISTNLYKYYDTIAAACVVICPNGYFPLASNVNYFCEKCQSNCLTCIDIATKCASCTSPNIIYLNECVLTCPEGLYTDSITCVKCDASCKSCSGNATKCDVCADGYARKTITS